jgi:hypothetical protein
MIFSLSLRTRCATASSRGSAAAALWVALLLDLRERAPARVPLLLLRFVVRLAVLALERLVLERVPLERPDDLRADDEPPELEPEPLLLA